MTFTQKDRNASGTSYQTAVDAPYAALAALFGPGNVESFDKTSTEWRFVNDLGQPVTLYDYKATDGSLDSIEAFRARPIYAWHVGAYNRATALNFVAWLDKLLRGVPK